MSNRIKNSQLRTISKSEHLSRSKPMMTSTVPKINHTKMEQLTPKTINKTHKTISTNTINTINTFRIPNISKTTNKCSRTNMAKKLKITLITQKTKKVNTRKGSRTYMKLGTFIILMVIMITSKNSSNIRIIKKIQMKLKNEIIMRLYKKLKQTVFMYFYLIPLFFFKIMNFYL